MQSIHTKNSLRATVTAIRGRTIFGLVAAVSIGTPLAWAGGDAGDQRRIGPTVVSADGHWLVWQQQDIDKVAKRGVASLWSLDLTTKTAKPESLVSSIAHNAHEPVFTANSDWIYFTSDMSGVEQLWRVKPAEGIPEQVTR
jgi:hypothetical protein